MVTIPSAPRDFGLKIVFFLAELTLRSMEEREGRAISPPKTTCDISVFFDGLARFLDVASGSLGKDDVENRDDVF